MPEPDDLPILEVRGVRAAYGSIEVLHGVDLTVAGGEVLAVLGPNGAGKTTLLAVLAGLVTPTAGTVLMEGRDVTGASAQDLSRAGVCLVPEGRGIFPNLTVRENVLMDTFSTGGARTTAELEERTYARFPRLGERVGQQAGTLSGGEQQMLALARALSTEPALILLDELSMGLAPTIVAELFDVVRGLSADGVTTIVVEQFAGVTAFADRVAVMTQGRLRVLDQGVTVADELATAYLGAGR